jgi:sugar lactone lactonase YvrE
MNTRFSRFFTWLAFARLAATALASTHYVSPSGSDSASGTLAQPFATVQHGVSQLAPGDVLLLRDGVYHESVTVTRSGTAVAPILIQAAPGETPVLVGARPVTGTWTVQAGSIYRAPWPTQPVQVFCDGRLLNEARWPNSPLPDDLSAQACAFTDDGSANDMVYANLPAVDLTGAWVQIVAGEAWVGYSRQIVTHDRASGRLTFASPINQSSFLLPRRNNRFFVFGKLELLDAPGEWWWDPVGQQLYVWTPDGAAPANRVEAGTADSVLSLSGQSYVTVAGLNARGGWFNLQNCTACVVNDCHLVAPTWIRTFDGWTIYPTPYLGGIDVSGSGNVVQGGSVRLAGRSGVHLQGSDNTVRQVLVEDCGWNWTNNAAVDTVYASRATVENCTILRTSGTGLTMGPASRFLRNLVDTTSIDFEDNGDVGAWSMDGQGSEVAYNEIHGNHSRWGAGIYLDAGTKNFYVHDNYVHDVQWNGINITGPMRVEHNTFVAVQHQGLGVIPQSSTDGVDMSAGILAHNLAAEPFPIDVMLGQPVALDPEYAMFGTSTPLAPGPRRVEILCTQLVQPGWSQREVPLDLSVVNTVVFNFETPANSYTYSIANLRLLPTGATGDAGAIPVVGATAQAGASGGSSCTLSTPAAATWSVTGANAFRGANNLTVTLPAGMTDWRTYRGFAFELVGTATRDYKFQGYQDIDNGPAAVPGRGATLPADIGAPAAGLGPVTPPTVTTQPASNSSGPGGSVSFTADANGNPAPTYRWQRLAAGSTVWTDLTEGGSYRGVLGETLTINAPTAVMSGDQFRCVTTSAVGSAISNAATLTVGGSARNLFQSPVGLTIDGAGNLYVADAGANTICKVNPAGQVTTLAGSAGSVGSQDGATSDARFNQPGALSADSAGNLYVADTGNATIRKISPAGVVTTVAGSASNRGNRDGLGSAAWFNSPAGIAVGASGILYVADTLNATIRGIAPDGTVSTLAGMPGVSGDADGTGTAARFNHPAGIATDNRQIYVVDTYNSTVRRITLGGMVTTVAGSAGISGSNDGTGSYALFNQPAGVAVDPASNAASFYVSDTGNGTIRLVTANGGVATLAGFAGIAGLGDGTGPNALFNQPRGLVVDARRNLWVADSANGAIRKVAPDGVVTTLALTAGPSGGTTPTPSGGSGTNPPPSTPASGGSGSGGGGGGAPSAWFCGALLLLAAARRYQRRVA